MTWELCVTPCPFVSGCRRFEKSQCLHLQRSWALNPYRSSLHPFENSGKRNPSTRRHIPEDLNPYLHAILCLAVTKRKLSFYFETTRALICRMNRWIELHRNTAGTARSSSGLVWLLSVSVPNCNAHKTYVRNNTVQMKKLKFIFVSLWRIRLKLYSMTLTL
jgi:hypothetical protein